MPSGIVSVKAEVVTEVYDPAFGLDVVCVDELTGNAVAEAKEDHIRIIQLLAEAQVSLADEVTMDRCDRRTLRRSRRRCDDLHIRVVHQDPEQLASGVSRSSGNRHSYSFTL